MQVKEIMKNHVHVVSPDMSILEAARAMADHDCGALPVAENDKLIGMLTDRDIVVRALAKGKQTNSIVRDAMSPQVWYCYEDDEVEDVARNMAEMRVCRQVVLDKNKRLAGILSLGDIAETEEDDCASDAVRCAAMTSRRSN